MVGAGRCQGGWPCPWAGGPAAPQACGCGEQECHGAWWEKGRQSHFSLSACFFAFCEAGVCERLLCPHCVCSLALHTCPVSLCTELKLGTELGARKGKKSFLIFTQSPSNPTNSFTTIKKQNKTNQTKKKVVV